MKKSNRIILVLGLALVLIQLTQIRLSAFDRPPCEVACWEADWAGWCAAIGTPGEPCVSTERNACIRACAF